MNVGLLSLSTEKMTSPKRLFLFTTSGLLCLSTPDQSHAEITYSLHFDRNLNAQTQQLANSVATVAEFHNEHGSFNKHWNVYYNTGIPTAEGNIDGYMGYGNIFNERVVFHEAAHTFGMGTHGNYFTLISGGLWKGIYGNEAQFDTYNNYGDGLHGDNHAIWPGGFNYDNEDGFIERFWRTRIMAAIRSDMGILSFTREARHCALIAGKRATFEVESPVASSFQWYRNNSPLSNGGDFSGTNTKTLIINNVSATDAGSYRCRISGAGETLDSRPRQLWIYSQPQRGLWGFNNSLVDSQNGLRASAFGGPTYTTGKSGQAINLDGVDDYLDLPDEISRLRDLTIATWVNWDGGNDWQRIFDFGSNTFQNFFLTPKAGGGGLRLVLKDSINGKNQEYQINSDPLPTGQWIHLAAVIEDNTMKLYQDGKLIGSSISVESSPADFLQPTNNYVGKSQYPDPLLNGQLDDFHVYARALQGNEIWNLWGGSTNHAPAFTQDPVLLPAAEVQNAYTGQTLAQFATDEDAETLIFTKISGPDWIKVASNGSLSGTPIFGDINAGELVVRVSDPSGATAEARILIDVVASGTVAYWNFEEGAANSAVPYSPTSAGQYDGSLLDQSGNSNHASTWGANWMRYRALVGATTTPKNGVTNRLSLQNGGTYPAVSAIGTALTAWSPRSWTIEATIRPDDATNGYQTFIGRDSYGAFAGDINLAALYFGLIPNGALRFMFTDGAGNNWNLTSEANIVQDMQWHAVAATSDGATLKLYLKNLTDAQENYTLLGTLDLSSSSNPVISTGAGDGGDWDAGVWSIARGLWAGGHTDRFYGHLDDIRFSGSALDPSEFLYTPNSPGDRWRITHFGSPENTGIAADSANPDGDLLNNSLERALGGNPNLSDNHLLPQIRSNSSSSTFSYQRALDASDIAMIVEESTSLEEGSWSPARGTYSIISNDGEVQQIQLTRSSLASQRVFLRLRVIHH